MPDEAKDTVNIAAKFGAKIKALLMRATAAEKEAADLKTANAALVTKTTELEKQVLSPDAKDKRIAELTATIRGGKHKARFAALAKDAGFPEAAIDDLYALSGHKAETDEPDDEALKTLVEKVKAEKAWALGKPAAGDGGNPPAPEPKPIPGAGRGAGHQGQDGTIITAEQRANPKFMLNPANRDVIHAAAKEGRFR